MAFWRQPDSDEAATTELDSGSLVWSIGLFLSHVAPYVVTDSMYTPSNSLRNGVDGHDLEEQAISVFCSL